MTTMLASDLPLPRIGRGKVRDIYAVGGEHVLLLTTDRVSAFDRVLSAIPFKGQVLNQLSVWWFDQFRDIVGNHVLDVPDPNVTIMLCLSCHDGSLAVNGMMTGQTVEAVPNAIGGHAPTWLGNDGGTKNDYNNDHPVGPKATIGCGGQYNWDCTIVGGKITYPAGSKMFNFVQDYGFAVSTVTFDGVNPAVACTTCHDQHAMNAYNGTIAGVKGTYQTSFFVRGSQLSTQSQPGSCATVCIASR